MLGGSVSATPWDQERELEVGGLTAIRNADDPTDVLWSITQAREPGHRLSEVQIDNTTYPIAHDDAGRLTTGPIFDFVYDANHRLSVVEAFGNDVEVYLYTADGDLAAVIGRTRHVFAYDGTQMIAAFDLNGDPQWEATFGDGIDQLIEYRDFAASSAVVPLADHRNSPIATWNPTTEAIEQLARYDLHGRLTLLDANEMQLCAEQDNPGVVCDPPSAMPFAFNGRWRSPLTGLVNMRARWYSPRLGQFTAPDPLEYVDLYNLYGFAAFDPVNGWDPNGTDTFCFFDCRKRELEQQFDLPPQKLAKQQQAGEEMMTGAGKGVRNMGKTITCMGGTAWAGPLAGLAACSLEVFQPEEMDGPFEEVGDNIVFTISIAGGPEVVVVGATRLLQLLRRVYGAVGPWEPCSATLTLTVAE